LLQPRFFKGIFRVVTGRYYTPFLTPKIFKFDFEDFQTEDEMMMKITNTTFSYRPDIMDATETFVIQLIHKIPEF
jgi:hypothetical protein